MSKSIIKTKIIPLILIFTFVFPLSYFVAPPEKARAQGIPVYDNAINLWNTYLSPFLSKAGRQMAISLVQYFVSETVKWIDSGFQGNPAFISNPSEFLQNAGDQAVGDFIFNNPNLRFLCYPFQTRIKLALGLIYKPFQKQINCTLSGVLKNAQGSYNDFMAGNFIEGGGWDSWLQISTQPQNTELGSLLMAKAELDLKVGDKKLSDVTGPLSWSGGALDFKKCTEQKYIVTIGEDGELTKVNTGTSKTFSGSPLYRPPANTNIGALNLDEADSGQEYTDTNCITTTPGKIIAEKFGFAATSDQRVTELQTTVTNGMDAIFSALLNQLVTQALTKLKEGLLGNSQSQTVDYRALLNQQLSTLQNQQSNAIQNYNQSQNSVSNNTNSIKSSAITTINNAISNQQTNLSNYLQASSTLGAAIAQFASSSACNMPPYSNNTTDNLRASMIRTNVISVLNGTANPTVGFNTQIIAQNTNITKANITTLQNILNTVNSTQDNTLINNQAPQVTSINQNSTSTATLHADILSWLNNNSKSHYIDYTTTACPINPVWQQVQQ
ncbi:MAG: hypothetical protein WC631_02905 [Candidatus Paceibacterota bacterium]|jgi:hypothetical protein